MIVVRNVFQIKYAQMRAAKDALKHMNTALEAAHPSKPRVMTDLTGPAYTLVLEFEYPSLAEFEATAPKIFGTKEWQEMYSKFTPHVESSHREIYTIEG